MILRSGPAVVPRLLFGSPAVSCVKVDVVWSAAPFEIGMLLLWGALVDKG